MPDYIPVVAFFAVLIFSGFEVPVVFNFGVV
jgi:hypothetical protein